VARGAYSAPQTSYLGLRGPTLRPLLLRGVEGGKGRGHQMIYAPRHQKPSCYH